MLPHFNTIFSGNAIRRHSLHNILLDKYNHDSRRYLVRWKNRCGYEAWDIGNIAFGYNPDIKGEDFFFGFGRERIAYYDNILELYEILNG